MTIWYSLQRCCNMPEENFTDGSESDLRTFFLVFRLLCRNWPSDWLLACQLLAFHASKIILRIGRKAVCGTFWFWIVPWLPERLTIGCQLLAFHASVVAIRRPSTVLHGNIRIVRLLILRTISSERKKRPLSCTEPTNPSVFFFPPHGWCNLLLVDVDVAVAVVDVDAAIVVCCNCWWLYCSCWCCRCSRVNQTPLSVQFPAAALLPVLRNKLLYSYTRFPSGTWEGSVARMNWKT